MNTTSSAMSLFTTRPERVGMTMLLAYVFTWKCLRYEGSTWRTEYKYLERKVLELW